MLLENQRPRYLQRLLAMFPSRAQAAPPAVAAAPVPPPPPLPQPLGDSRLRPKRAIVISNCQCLPLAAWLTVLSADTVFDFWGVHLLNPGQWQADIEAFAAKARAEYDFILSIPLSDDYLELSTPRIAESFAGLPVIRISNIYFSGLQPDQTYIGGLNQRVAGPLGDAHSKLAIHGFMTGLSIDQTMSLFCAESYARLGYYDEFSTSLDELKKRDSAVDVPVTRFLEETLRTALSFYSFNHPTPAVFSAYAADVTQHLAARGLAEPCGFPADSALCAETLAGNIIFPVYPEIAAHHGVPHIGSYAFKADGPWVNPMPLKRFLTLEFEAFEEVGRETLALSHAAQMIAARFGVLSA